MNIQAQAAKVAAKQLSKGWKAIFERVRVWATKDARKRQGKEMINPYVIAFAMLSMTGCATVDNLLIAADDNLYASSTATVAIPPGYDARPYVIDAVANRIDVDGWQVKWEIVPSASFKATLLSEAIAKPRKQSVMGPVMDLIADNQAKPSESSGASSAAQAIIDAAKAEGVTP